MKIIIETIPHKDQRYPTVGDYFIDADGTIHIKVSELGNEMEEVAVALHEMVELFLLRKKGVSVEEVDEFDMSYELARSTNIELGTTECLITETSEPGDHPEAPYRDEHRFAENLERQFILQSGIVWSEYNRKVEEL